MSELGQEKNLLSEFEPQNIVDGGYVEPSRLRKGVQELRTMYSAYMTGQSQQEWIEAEEMQRLEEK